MARYIDADALEKEIKLEASEDIARAVIRIIDRQPTADVVEVVRCKDCKYYVANYCARDIKGRTNMFYMESDDFCSYGERRDT